MGKYIIGIDLSITSTGMTILDVENKKYTFFNFPGMEQGKNISYKSHAKAIANNGDFFSDIVLVPYTRYKQAKKDSKEYDYIIEQRLKIKEAMNLTGTIVGTIKEHTEPDSEISIAIEGFSYGSQSSSYIDLIMYQSVARAVLVATFGENCLNIISPSDNKKFFSSKGNANKALMIKSFIDQHVKDDIVVETSLYKYAKNERIDEAKDPKPIDDIVDSYALVTSLIHKTQTA